MNRKTCLWLLLVLFAAVCCALPSAALAQDVSYIPLTEWYQFDDTEGLVQTLDAAGDEPRNRNKAA